MIHTSFLTKSFSYLSSGTNPYPCSEAEISFQFRLKSALPRCFQVAIALILLDRASRVRTCQKTEHVICGVGIEGFLRCHSEL
jgi:hypothetical protein